ncbi:hypothetical protein [Actinoplanes awajinensis]|uniref:hypothetical protein n=1 Tax=Actinoplanes awajinensis TaxID=135946 RepID=UPI0012F9ADDC|nr:hypothetical protein [Actinoplanes awajinensis]
MYGFPANRGEAYRLGHRLQWFAQYRHRVLLGPGVPSAEEAVADPVAKPHFASAAAKVSTATIKPYADTKWEHPWREELAP